ncbi:MAG: LytTR family DNA-binding domain-containing protein [Clostridium sp.]|nr:LytTR family DNA-binding domain-containing protein [Clostridium sp.]
MDIAIVEDEPVHSRLLKQYIGAWAEAHGRSVSILTYENAAAFLFCLEDGAPDAVFADIQMPGMNGMEMVRKLREKNRDIPVVFTTGLSEYLKEGYEVQALHYLLKPISEEKVFECMDRICAKVSVRELFAVRTQDGVTRLDLKEVNYCEADRHDTRFVMTDRSEIRVMENISGLWAELSGKNFVKCHRSYLCNLENVRQIVRDHILFDNGDTVPVSRRMYPDVNRLFIALYRGCVEK